VKYWCAGLWGLLAGAWLIGNSLAETKAVAPATPEAAAEWALNLPRNGRSQALHGVISGWAEVDPAAAAQWSQKLPDQEKWVMNSALASWARKDPDTAAAWALKIPEGPQRTQALEQVGQAWGGKNRATAMVWAEKLPSESDRKVAIGGVVQSWATQDYVAALQFAEEQSDAKLKEHFLGRVIYGWCFKDRAAAEKWVKELPEGNLKKATEKALAEAPVIRRRVASIPPTGSNEVRKKITLHFETPPELGKIMESPLNQARQDAIQRYVLEWFGRDKEKAIQWIPAKLQGYVLGVCAGTVAREWSKTDLAAAAAWVRQIPPFFRDFVARMGAEWAAEKPKHVAEAVLQWPDNSRREVVMRGVCEVWGQKDAAAALKWMETLPRGATRTGALKGVVIGWSQSQANDCRAWAEKITDENDKRDAQHYILHGLARSNPQEAIAYLSSLANQETNYNHIYCLGKEWALRDAPGAAEWAKSLPAGLQQQDALQAVLRQWVYADAIRSADWAVKLAEKESRIAAFEAVMEKWMEQRPREALDWSEGITTADHKLEARLAAVKSWAKIEPQGALEWVNKLPEGGEKGALLEELKPPQKVSLAAGQAAPEFKASTLDGKEFQLSDYRGKFVLLDFWATWCGPCLAETPNLKKVHEAFGKRDDFVLIGLSLDRDPEKPRAYLKENQCGWVDGFLGDWGKDKVTQKYGVQGIPSIWLIGPDGKIVHKGLRGEQIYEAVNSALQAKK